jgi:hypothetical protein
MADVVRTSLCLPSCMGDEKRRYAFSQISSSPYACKLFGLSDTILLYYIPVFYGGGILYMVIMA